MELVLARVSPWVLCSVLTGVQPLCWLYFLNRSLFLTVLPRYSFHCALLVTVGALGLAQLVEEIHRWPFIINKLMIFQNDWVLMRTHNVIMRQGCSLWYTHRQLQDQLKSSLRVYKECILVSLVSAHRFTGLYCFDSLIAQSVTPFAAEKADVFSKNAVKNPQCAACRGPNHTQASWWTQGCIYHLLVLNNKSFWHNNAKKDDVDLFLIIKDNYTLCPSNGTFFSVKLQNDLYIAQ